MHKYAANRILVSIPTLIGITILIFVAMRVLPGDPLALITVEGQGTQRLTEEELAKARHDLGLDRPYHVQYLAWMGDVLRGDMGHSFWRGEPISELILRRGPISAQIAVMAVVLSWLIGLPVGILSATKRNSALDYVVRSLVTLFMAVPSFWVGLVIVLVGVLVFTWRPPLSIVYFWDDPGRNLQITLGPAFVLGMGLGAVTARMARSAVLEALHHDYARTARAKGLSERIVVWKHVLRNALLPIITLSGLAVGGLLGGSVTVERAFGVPGLGMALVQALNERDWTMIQNLVLLYGVIFTLVNLLVDLSYAWLDPRIRYQ
ncbi:MAG TPA: ABC transporter permease [Chloroflexota bacterium]|jgi:peptide/nickel transport system permease protein|nr:ABC transporter permease [Chloroflexota bacterium]